MNDIRWQEPISVTVKDACRLIGVGKTTAYELIKAGIWEKVKIGRKTVITMASLKRQATSQGKDITQ